MQVRYPKRETVVNNNLAATNPQSRIKSSYEPPGILAPESVNLQCKPGVSNTTIFCCSRTRQCVRKSAERSHGPSEKTRKLIGSQPNWPLCPREALCEDIPGYILEKWVRSWSHLMDSDRQKMTRSTGNGLHTPTKGFAWIRTRGDLVLPGSVLDPSPTLQPCPF